MAALYNTYEDWKHHQPVKTDSVSGSGPVVSFTFPSLLPGSYYLEVWKDTDNSGDRSCGDIVGWFGSGSLGSQGLTPFQVQEGETVNIGDLTMHVIPPAAQHTKRFRQGS